MNFVITYFIQGYKFRGVFNNEEYAELEKKEFRGQLSIYEVIAAPGTYLPKTED